MPKRIQLRRTKGWRLPEGAVIVDRRTRWGNPYVVHNCDHRCDETDRIDCPTRAATDQAGAVRLYRHAVLFPMSDDPKVPSPEEIRDGLAGRDLACWCALSAPCHADVLIEIANAEEANTYA